MRNNEYFSLKSSNENTSLLELTDDENYIQNFDRKFKKSLLYFSFILSIFLIIIVINSYSENNNLLKASFGDNNIEDKCTIKNIFLNIIEISFLITIVIIIFIIILGLGILGYFENSIFSCFQSTDCVTSDSLCATCQRLIMTNFHLIPIYTFLTILFMTISYNIIECI